MRNGRLICEKNPQHLISTTASVSLEEALYKLCKQQDTVPFNDQIDHKPQSLNSENMSIQKTSKEAPFPVKKEQRRTKYIKHLSLTAFSAVCKRTWKLLIADKLNLFLMLFYPSIVLYMIALSFHQLPDVEVAILNDDQFIVGGGETINSNQTRSFARKLVDSMATSVHLVSVKFTSFVFTIKLTNNFAAPRKQH